MSFSIPAPSSGVAVLSSSQTLYRSFPCQARKTRSRRCSSSSQKVCQLFGSPCGHRTVISHSDYYSIFKVQWRGLSLIPTGRGQMHPLNGKNIWEFKKSFHLFPLGRTKLSGVFEKIFCFAKDPFTHLDKGAEMHTHFWGFPRKNFYLVKRPPHLFGIGKPKRTLFFRKKAKKFARLY